MSEQQANRAAVRRSRRFGPVAIGLALVALVLSWGGPAAAHSGQDSYVYLDVTETSLSGRAELPIADLREALGLPLVGTDAEIISELLANQDELIAYTDEHFAIGAEVADGATEWELDFGEAELFFSELQEADDNYIVLPFDVVVDGQVPRTFDVQFDPFLDENEIGNHLLLIGNDWQAGVIDNGFEDLATFNDATRVQTIDLGDTSVLSNFTSSVELGVDHIKTGPDHILFVLVLLLPSVLIFRNGWKPTDGFMFSLWRVLKVVTMFTIAHSITFTLAGLGLLPLPSPRIVESIIAVSIAVAAVHNIRPLAANQEWLISFVFGLFHGMGFASLVAGLDVSRSTQLISLLGRNVGIEIGQAIVVLLLFPALFLLRRTVYYRPFFVMASVLLTILALGWMLERAWEIDLGMDTVVDPVFDFPRILFFVAGFTVLAAVIQRFEGSRGRLLPTAGDDSAAPAEDVLETVAS